MNNHGTELKDETNNPQALCHFLSVARNTP